MPRPFWHCQCSILPSSPKARLIVCLLRASGQYCLRHTSDLPLSSAFHLYSPILGLSRATQTGTSTSHLNFHWQEGTQKPLSNHRDWFTLKTRPGSKDSGFIVLYSDIRTFLPATQRIQNFHFDYYRSSGCFLPRTRKHISEKEIKEQNQAPPLLLFSCSTLKPTF